MTGPGGPFTFTGMIGVNHIFYLEDDADLTAARALIPTATATAAFGTRDAGFYILNNDGEVLGDVRQRAADLSGKDKAYIGASLHGTTGKMLSALEGHDTFEILPDSRQEAGVRPEPM